MDNCIFYFRPHFLSTDCRKSRNKSFSIFKHLFSYLYSASVFADFLPRFFGMAGILGSFNQLWIAYLLIPYSLLSARWVSPSCSRATTASRISLGYLFIPFFPDITIPPFVVISSYLRGLLSIVRFFWCCSAVTASFDKFSNGDPFFSPVRRVPDAAFHIRAGSANPADVRSHREIR